MERAVPASADAPGEKARPEPEYDAQVASPLLGGQAKVAVGEEGITITALFDAVEIPYADIESLALEDYGAALAVAGVGQVRFSRMGSWCAPFYAAAFEAYNKKVLKALFVEGRPVLEAKGSYLAVEGGAAAGGAAPVQVYENCVCVLPPNLGARRIPLCFVAGLEKGDYALTLRMDNGDSVTFERLGYDAEPFAAAVERQIRGLRERALAAVRGVDPALTATQAAALAKLMPEGAAAPVGKLAAIAPGFVQALEQAIGESRAAESYAVLKALCGPERMCIGFKKNAARAGPGEGGPEAAPAAPEELMLWMIAPSPDGRACAVEFAGGAGAAAATFVYRLAGGDGDLVGALNRALEATAFRREVIRLTEAELRQPQNAAYRMAVQRTRAIQFVRGHYAGRAIHAGADSWKKQLTALWDGRPPPRA